MCVCARACLCMYVCSKKLTIKTCHFFSVWATYGFTQSVVFGLNFVCQQMPPNPVFCMKLSNLDFDSRPQEYETAKTLEPYISQCSQSVWIEFGLVLRLVSQMNLIFLVFGLINIQGREPYIHKFIGNKKVGLHLNIYRLISFKLDMMTIIAEIHNFIPVWMTLAI